LTVAQGFSDVTQSFSTSFSSPPLVTTSLRATDVDSTFSAKYVEGLVTNVTTSSFDYRITKDPRILRNIHIGVEFRSLVFASINGYPAIAYARGDIGIGGVNFVIANDPDGLSWRDPINVGELNYNFFALTEINGNPAIAASEDNGSLYFFRAGDQMGTSWPPAVTINDSSVTLEEARGVQLQEVEGNPAIAVINFNPALNGYSVRYLRANNYNGTVWPAYGAVQEISNVFTEPILSLGFKIVGGNPAVSYVVSAVNIFYARSSDSIGTIPWVTDSLLVSTGRYTDLVDTPIGATVLYTDTTNNVIAVNKNTGSWAFATIDTGLAREVVKAESVCGVPMAIYVHGVSPTLRYSYQPESAVTGFTWITGVDSASNVSALSTTNEMIGLGADTSKVYAGFLTDDSPSTAPTIGRFISFVPALTVNIDYTAV